MRKGRFNNKEKYFTNKSSISVPNYPSSSVESTTHVVREQSGITAQTAFQKVRSYDATVDKIDINIVGAAPIFGPKSPDVLTKMPNDMALFTGALNDAYYNDDFALLSTITREIKLNYWGMNYRPMTAGGKNPLTNKSFYTWESNMTTLISQLDAAMYTDLRWTNWAFQNRDATATPKDFSMYNQVHTAQSYMLISYQTEISILMLTLLNFEMLTSQLPKLQELYKGKTDYFVRIQNELKRSAFTSKVRSLMTWLKKRYVDRSFFRDYILPTAVVSKETDGLNSPIIFLQQALTIPIQPIQYVDPYTNQPDKLSSSITQGFFISNLTVSRETATGKEGAISEISTKGGIPVRDYLWTRVANAFNINTILEMILGAQSTNEFNVRLNVWLKTAQQVLTRLMDEALDFSRQQWFIDTESVLAKLASQPGGLSWVQNIEFMSIPPVMKYSNYQLVNDLATFMASKPIPNGNGYTMELPLFKKRGLPTQLVYEYAQAYYLESDDEFMSFISLSNRIRFITRDNKIIEGQVEYPTSGSHQNRPYLKLKSVNVTWDAQGNRNETTASIALSDPNTRAYLVLQDYFTYITDDHSNTWINPDLMRFIPANFQNKWAELAIYATQNFIIPQA